VTLTQDGRSWFGSALPIALIDGLRVLQPQLVILLLGLMLTAGDVGLYRVAVATAIMVAVPMTLVGSVVTPLWARLHAESDRRRMQLLSTRSAQLMTAGVLVLSLPVILFGREIIGLLFGAEYRLAYPALAVLCAGQLVQAFFSPNGGLLLMTGHERRVTRATFLSLLSCVAMLFILVPRFGMLGAALATSFAMLVWNLLCWRDARRRLGIDTSVLGTLRRG
jgi:O-antigen/teichoic acid export membrane protein